MAGWVKEGTSDPKVLGSNPRLAEAANLSKNVTGQPRSERRSKGGYPWPHILPHAHENNDEEKWCHTLPQYANKAWGQSMRPTPMGMAAQSDIWTNPSV